MGNNKENFLMQTSKDYDMSYDDVKYIYELWNQKGLFYQKLEEHLKERKN